MKKWREKIIANLLNTGFSVHKVVGYHCSTEALLCYQIDRRTTGQVLNQNDPSYSGFYQSNDEGHMRVFYRDSGLVHESAPGYDKFLPGK